MRHLLAALALVLLALVGPVGPLVAPALAQEAPAATEPAPAEDGGGGFGFSLPDPRAWAAALFDQVLVNLLNGLSDGLHRLVQGVLGSSANVISRTPPDLSYHSPTVQALRRPVQAAANAALLLVAVWGGLNLVVRQHLGAVYHDALELLPRLALGALLVNTSDAWVRLLIDLNNALCALVGEATPPAWDQVDRASQALAGALAALVYLLAALLLVIQMLVRLALLDVLLVVAPLALLGWVLPQTQGWARLWTGTFTRVVFTQFVQVVALKLGASLLTELRGASADAALMAPFLGLAALLVVLKLPGLIGGQGGGFGFVQYVAYRYAFQGLGVAGRGGAGGRPAATTSGRGT